MVVKSTKLAKSTGWLGGVIVTVKPPVVTRAAELIVTENDSTSQVGWSVPKTTSDPDGPVVAAGLTILVPLPQPTIRTVARPATSAGKIIRFLLLIPNLPPPLLLLLADLPTAHWYYSTK
jgi:hypothetical protein